MKNTLYARFCAYTSMEEGDCYQWSHGDNILSTLHCILRRVELSLKYHYEFPLLGVWVNQTTPNFN